MPIYLGDRAISKLIKFTFQGDQNFLWLPVDIQINLALNYYIGKYDGWEIYVKE